MKRKMIYKVALLFVPVFALLSCNKEQKTDYSEFNAYVNYRNRGGNMLYSKWIKEGSPDTPKSSEEIGKKGEKGADVVDAKIDENGNLVTTLSNGKKIITPIPKRKLHKVKFYGAHKLLAVDNVIHGNKLKFPKLDFEYKDGWYLDESFTNRWNFAFNVTKCLNLYANIDVSKTYKVTFVDAKFGHSFEPLTIRFEEHYNLPTM